MSLPTDPEERDALIAEYVLGTLDMRASDRVRAAAARDPAIAAAIDAWENRLAPLSRLARPEAPPPELWDRIESAISPAPAALRPSAPSRLWRWWSLGATLAAAAFAAIAFLPQAPGPTRYMTVLVTDPGMPAWAAQTDSAGALRVSAIPALNGTAPQAPSGRALELWGLAPGAKAPVSLGLLPGNGGQVTVPAAKARPVKGMQILISVEPEGGAPNGAPTGPVIFYGRLSEAGPDT
jgi:anti-sigma-K factor RskA